MHVFGRAPDLLSEKASLTASIDSLGLLSLITVSKTIEAVIQE
jgi:hypothetical protein